MDNTTEASVGSRRRIAQTAATVAAAGAAAWIALASDSIIRPESYRYRDALLLVPWVLLAATLLSVHQLQRDCAGALERWGIRALLGGMAIVAVGNLHIVLANADSNFAFPLGALIFIGGLLTFGIGTVRAGVFPRSVGVAIAVSQLLTMVTGVALSPLVPLYDYGNYSGALAHGIVMLFVAANLKDHARTLSSVNALPVGVP